MEDSQIYLFYHWVLSPINYVLGILDVADLKGVGLTINEEEEINSMKNFSLDALERLKRFYKDPKNSEKIIFLEEALKIDWKSFGELEKVIEDYHQRFP